MKITAFWVSVTLSAARALADSTESKATSAVTATATTSSTASTCTASLITSLCSYPEPDSKFAVAIESKASCWDYCNAHPPCSFEIFVPGNPTLGTGTCWLYPGETFNATEGGSDCSNPYLSVYDQPVCSGGSATTTTGACTATATPSAIASVCGYPTPENNCNDDCYASTGASNCLSLCVEADSCSYAVFNPQDSSSQYASGSCWVYSSGTYNADSATTCSGDPEQFVYKNPCPKPSSSTSSSTQAQGRSVATGTAGNGTGSPASAATGSPTSSPNSAPAGLSITSAWAMGMASLVWYALY
ncbi:unnamed protein product [Penicillium salamii]|nr:unnamed protein product [Penicillium salamii]